MGLPEYNDRLLLTDSNMEIMNKLKKEAKKKRIIIYYAYRHSHRECSFPLRFIKLSTLAMS